MYCYTAKNMDRELDLIIKRHKEQVDEFKEYIQADRMKKYILVMKVESDTNLHFDKCNDIAKILNNISNTTKYSCTPFNNYSKLYYKKD